MPFRTLVNLPSDDAFAPRGKLIKGNFDFINISVYMNECLPEIYEA